MLATLLTTKLFTPTTQRYLVARPQLSKYLDEGLEKKITLVSAPAGYGKTTLLSEWASQCECLVAWLSLDGSDNDLRRFLTYFTAALQTVAPSFGEGVLNLIQAPQMPPVETVLTAIINEVAEQPERIVLVLDDYHLITTQPVHEALEFILGYLPPQMHLVLIGRIDPPLPLARLRVRGELNEIRANDLRFSAEEVETYLNDLMDLELPPGDINALQARTEGWIASLQLAALSLRGRTDKSAFVAAFSGSHHYIIDYLVHEVMTRLSEEIQTFLWQTSIFDRFNAPLCNAALGISNSKLILKDLEEANLFLVALDDEHVWYRYHHLFAEFLHQRLREGDLESIPDLHRRASEWFEQNSLFPEAIDHALTAQDFARAAHLVENIGPNMMMQSEFDQLTEWLDAIPQRLVGAWPWLCIIRAWMCQRWARLEEAEEYLRSAEQALEVESTPEPMGGANIIRGQVAAIRSLIALVNMQIPQAIEYANQALDFLPVDHFNRAVAADALGIAKRMLGDFEGAITILVEARRQSLAVGNCILAQAIIVEIGRTQVMQGRLHQAADNFRDAIAYTYQKTNVKIPYASSACVFLADILREWDDLEGALAYLEEGIEVGLQAQMVDAIAIGYAIKTRVHLAQGDLEAATAACQNARRKADDIPNPEWDTIPHLQESQIRLALAQNNLREAARIVMSSGVKASDKIQHYHEFKHLGLARVLVHQDRENPEENYLFESLDLISRSLEVLKSVGCLREIISLLVLNALALKAQGEHELASQSLEEAIILAEPEGFVRTFVDEGQPLFRLLLPLRRHQRIGNYAQRLAAAFDPEGLRRRPRSEQSLVEPLSDRELDVLKLLTTDLSGPEIARELMVSLNTMRTHTKNIYSKLGVNSRRAAVRQAEELNLL